MQVWGTGAILKCYNLNDPKRCFDFVCLFDHPSQKGQMLNIIQCTKVVTFWGNMLFISLYWNITTLMHEIIWTFETSFCVSNLFWQSWGKWFHMFPALPTKMEHCTGTQCLEQTSLILTCDVKQENLQKLQVLARRTARQKQSPLKHPGASSWHWMWETWWMSRTINL